MLQVVVGDLQRLQPVGRDEEAEELEGGQVQLVVQEDRVPLPVVVVFEGRELAGLGDSSAEGRMRVQAHLLGQHFVIFLEGSFEHDQRLQLVREGG